MKTPDPVLLAKAESGDAEACYLVGVWHIKAMRSVADAHAKQALHWLWKAHHLGSKQSVTLLNPLATLTRGVRNKMPMRSTKGFVCKRCGDCCGNGSAIEISLDPRDIRRWRHEARYDILNHTVHLGMDAYDGWFSAKTGTEMSRCPWYRKTKNGSKCQIQTTKPMLCQYFPVTKRHALICDCKGYTIVGASAGLSVTCPLCHKGHVLGEDYLRKPNIHCPCGTTGVIEFEEDMWEISRQIEHCWERDNEIQLINSPCLIDHCCVMLDEGSYTARIFIQWCRGIGIE